MTTLKISDLSVGDWVKASGVAKRVHSIEFQNGAYFVHFSNPDTNSEDYLHAPFIEPIPITAEILEKNGFVRSTSQFIVYHTDKVWISYDKPSETWSVTMYINDVTSNLHANILHIHQLQHALRLAGIDKEINLL